jgi:hypothetical protein
MELISKNNIQEETAENLINGSPFKGRILNGGVLPCMGSFSVPSAAPRTMVSMASHGMKR